MNFLVNYVHGLDPKHLIKFKGSTLPGVELQEIKHADRSGFYLRLKITITPKIDHTYFSSEYLESLLCNVEENAAKIEFPHKVPYCYEEVE